MLKGFRCRHKRCRRPTTPLGHPSARSLPEAPKGSRPLCESEEGWDGNPLGERDREGLHRPCGTGPHRPQLSCSAAQSRIQAQRYTGGYDAVLRWAIRIGHRRPSLKDSTLGYYAAKAERRLDALVGVPAAHPAGANLQRQIKAWRTKVFVFMTNRDVPATNNISEREIRPSVVFRKVTGGFRSEWPRSPVILGGYGTISPFGRLPLIWAA